MSNTNRGKKIKRIGPRMRQVIEGCPWPNMLAAAEAVGPRGSRGFGYCTVYRAMKAGLVELSKNHPAYPGRGKGALVLKEAANGTNS
jgi:hypothetical protein